MSKSLAWRYLERIRIELAPIQAGRRSWRIRVRQLVERDADRVPEGRVNSSLGGFAQKSTSFEKAFFD